MASPREGQDMSKVDVLLSRLDGVRPTGAGRWIARCPAHGDKSPSLSVREIDDNRVLLHCFGGCSVEEVLSAIGMTFDDLFPEKALDHHGPRERRPFPAADVLRCLAFESLVIASSAVTLLDGRSFSEADRARLILAAGRVQAAADMAGVS
jgi:hypothetical protein